MTSPLKRPVVLIGGAVAVLAVAGAATLAIVSSRPETPAAPTPTTPVTTAPVTLATAAAPFEFQSNTPYATVTLKLPESIRDQPDLHAKLYSKSVKDLRAFSEGSQADRTEAGSDMDLGPYEKTISFDSGVETGRLFSLARSDYEFTGGAHGNSAYAGVLWDKALKREITAAALLRKGVDLSALDSALCAALNAEKKARDPSAEPVALGGKDGDIWSCPHAADTAIVLAAGTMPGKAGGLTFTVAPYIVGPYSDGPYRVTLAQSAIRSLLDPAYADEFGGDPKPLPKYEPQ